MRTRTRRKRKTEKKIRIKIKIETKRNPGDSFNHRGQFMPFYYQSKYPFAPIMLNARLFAAFAV